VGDQYDIFSIFPVVPFSSQVEELFEAKSRALFKLELELHSIIFRLSERIVRNDPFGSFWILLA